MPLIPQVCRAKTARIRGILFDKDGTLLDYAKSWNAVNLLAAQVAAGGDRDLYEYLLRVGGASPATGHVAADGILSTGSAAEIASAWVVAGARTDVNDLTRALNQLFLSVVERAVPVADLNILLRRLRDRGLKLGIASTDSEQAVRSTANRFGINGLVEFMAGYDSGFGVKPAPQVVAAFCSSVRLEPDEVAVIGDSVNDMLMGRIAGAGINIGVLSGTSTFDRLSAYADICIDSVVDVEGVLFA